MQTVEVVLQTKASMSFKAVLAANSLDINTKEKLRHEMKVTVDLTTPYNLGVILGASGSGKSTLLEKLFPGEVQLDSVLKPNEALIDHFPKDMPYDECAKLLNGIGLTSVPCWIKPIKTLSNGQKFRAEAVLRLIEDKPVTIIDEWTSVVDRTVGKVMSHCVQKMARRLKKKIVLASCHYDVIEWLDPDWVIDCNSQEFVDRRKLSKKDRKKKVSYASMFGKQDQKRGNILQSITI